MLSTAVDYRVPLNPRPIRAHCPSAIISADVQHSSIAGDDSPRRRVRDIALEFALSVCELRGLLQQTRSKSSQNKGGKLEMVQQQHLKGRCYDCISLGEQLVYISAEIGMNPDAISGEAHRQHEHARLLLKRQMNSLRLIAESLTHVYRLQTSNFDMSRGDAIKPQSPSCIIARQPWAGSHQSSYLVQLLREKLSRHHGSKLTQLLSSRLDSLEAMLLKLSPRQHPRVASRLAEILQLLSVTKLFQSRDGSHGLMIYSSLVSPSLRNSSEHRSPQSVKFPATPRFKVGKSTVHEGSHCQNSDGNTTLPQVESAYMALQRHVPSAHIPKADAATRSQKTVNPDTPGPCSYTISVNIIKKRYVKGQLYALDILACLFKFSMI